jgi:hypothetical protein
MKPAIFSSTPTKDYDRVTMHGIGRSLTKLRVGEVALRENRPHCIDLL